MIEHDCPFCGSKMSAYAKEEKYDETKNWKAIFYKFKCPKCGLEFWL